MSMLRNHDVDTGPCGPFGFYLIIIINKKSTGSRLKQHLGSVQFSPAGAIDLQQHNNNARGITGTTCVTIISKESIGSSNTWAVCDSHHRGSHRCIDLQQHNNNARGSTAMPCATNHR